MLPRNAPQQTQSKTFRHRSDTYECYDYPPPRWVQVELQKDSDRVERFIAAFEKLYGRKPRPEDAQGNFTLHVAQNMEMSVGGARSFLWTKPSRSFCLSLGLGLLRVRPRATGVPHCRFRMTVI